MLGSSFLMTMSKQPHHLQHQRRGTFTVERVTPRTIRGLAQWTTSTITIEWFSRATTMPTTMRLVTGITTMIDAEIAASRLMRQAAAVEQGTRVVTCVGPVATDCAMRARLTKRRWL